MQPQTQRHPPQHPRDPRGAVPPANLDVRTTCDAARFTITLEGDLDLATVAKLRDAIADACASPCSDVALDLTRLTFLDSSGIHAILELHAAVNDDGRLLTITPGPGRVQRALEVAGLAGLLPLSRARHRATH